MMLYRYKRTNNFKATVSHEFFSEDVIVRICDRTIEFRHPTIDYSGKVHKPNKCSNGMFSFGFTGLIDEGEYIMDDEESNIDCLVFNKK